jgi:hypothetical protein
MKGLAALLGVSVLLNIALIARGPTTPPEPARRAAAPAPPRTTPEERVSATYPDPAEVASLRDRVRRLEADPAVPAAAAVHALDPLAAFKEKLPRALRLVKDPRGLAAAGPESQVELSEVTVAFQRAKVDRWKDPKTYTDILGAVLEQVAAETKAPLSDFQEAELGRTLKEYEAALSGAADKDAFERYLLEMGPEAEILGKLRTYVTPEQEAKVMIFGAMSPWSASTAPWVDRSQAEAQAERLWTSAYGLDASQKAAVQAAARVYANAADALNTQFGRDALPGSESAEWRKRNAEILLQALSTLESSLTPEQRERLRSRRPAELRVYDPAAMRRHSR